VDPQQDIADCRGLPQIDTASKRAPLFVGVRLDLSVFVPLQTNWLPLDVAKQKVFGVMPFMTTVGTLNAPPIHMPRFVVETAVGPQP
jgi:hypothetical protein